MHFFKTWKDRDQTETQPEFVSCKADSFSSEDVIYNLIDLRDNVWLD